MRKTITIITTILLIGCTSNDENDEQSYDCECQFVSHPAQGTEPNRYSSIRICETTGIEFYDYEEGETPMVKNMSYKKVEIYSSQQNCD